MSVPLSPDAETRRLHMRSWRRGMREMDLILGGFADAELGAMPSGERRAYARLLEENDQALYAWVTGGEPAPPHHRSLLARIRAFHAIAPAPPIRGGE